MTVCLLVGLPGPAGGADDAEEAAKAAALQAALAWLALVDAGEYGESWAAASDYFRSAVGAARWVNTLHALRRPLGENTDRQVDEATYATQLPGAPDGEYVVIVFRSSFRNKRRAVETVTPQKGADGVWRVSGYYIK